MWTPRAGRVSFLESFLTPSSETVTYDAPKMGGLRRKGSAVANFTKKGAGARTKKATNLAPMFAKLRPRKLRKTSGGLADNLSAMRAKGAFK